MSRLLKKMASQNLSKYQGCLVGAVLGDCLGSKFEGTDHEAINMEALTSDFKKIDKQKGTRFLKACIIVHFHTDTAKAL